MGFRFLHLADVHLETCFGGRPATRERLRRATREAFTRAVDYALAERLHAVLVAGDFFDDRLLSLASELALVAQVRRLTEGGVWFLYACGNHDPGDAHQRAANLGFEAPADAAPDDWRRRVRIFRDPTPSTVTVRDGSGRAVGVVVAAGHARRDEGANLAAGFPVVEGVESSLPVVGLLHTCVDGAASAGEHARYAPSRSADYHRLDYSYWALGHIHRRQRAVEGLPVFYAGNLQGRTPREPGEKGGLLVEAHPRAAAEPRFVRFAPVRWERLEVSDLSEAASLSELAEALAQRIDAARSSPDEELAVVLELSGETRHALSLRDPEQRSEIEEELRERSGVLEIQLRCEGVVVPTDREALRHSPTALAEALSQIDRAHSDDTLLGAIVPEELAQRLEPGSDAERAYLRELLGDLGEELILRSVEDAA